MRLRFCLQPLRAIGASVDTSVRRFLSAQGLNAAICILSLSFNLDGKTNTPDNVKSVTYPFNLLSAQAQH